MEKWQIENEKIMSLRNKIYDDNRIKMTHDEMADIILQIYESAGNLGGKLTALMLNALSDIQYQLRSHESKNKYDRTVEDELNRLMQ